jgi:hypothetical protein
MASSSADAAAAAAAAASPFLIPPCRPQPVRDHFQTDAEAKAILDQVAREMAWGRCCEGEMRCGGGRREEVEGWDEGGLRMRERDKMMGGRREQIGPTQTWLFLARRRLNYSVSDSDRVTRIE